MPSRQCIIGTSTCWLNVSATTASAPKDAEMSVFIAIMPTSGSRERSPTVEALKAVKAMTRIKMPSALKMSALT